MSPSCADSQGDRSLRERILRPLGLFHPRWEPRSGVFFLKDTLMTPELFIVTAILGIVEGLTEFIPVSSTGHLILFDDLIGFHGPGNQVFEIVIQLGAILAVCWLYRAKLFGVAIGMFSDADDFRFARNVVLAFLPAAIVGVFAHDFIKSVLFSPWVVSVALIVGAPTAWQ